MTSKPRSKSYHWPSVVRCTIWLKPVRPTVPLITALVASLVLVRGVSGMVFVDMALPVALEVTNRTIGEQVITQVAEPLFDPFFRVEPAAGPNPANGKVDGIAARNSTSAVGSMTVDGLEDVARGLSKRSARLEAREAQIILLEQALSANRQDIEREVRRLEKLRDEISAMIVTVDEQEEQRLQQLVKVYETMKAKRAAAIFDRLDMPILMPVAKRMRETKLASIMAAMDPGKAKLVTNGLARELKLPQLQ